MDIFGIGPLEFVLIVLVALIILGPKDIGKAGMAIGKFLRKVVTSEEWRILTRASREITSLPTRLMREAGLEEIKKELPTPESLVKESGLADLQKDLKKEAQQVQAEFSAWTTPIDLNLPAPTVENKTPEPGSEPVPAEGNQATETASAPPPTEGNNASESGSGSAPAVENKAPESASETAPSTTDNKS